MSGDDRVNDLSTWDEAILLISNNQGDQLDKSRGKHFGNNFIEGITKADRSKLIRRVSTYLLRDKAQKGRIDFLEHLCSSKEFLHNITNIFTHKLLEFLEEKHGKTIRPWSLISSQGADSFENFIILRYRA